MHQIDLNCDLGESFGRYTIGNDIEIMKYISSANIACGFHAGDPNVMRETVKQAVQRGVKIGAHPGFADLQGFGRREMSIQPSEAYNLIIYQIGALQAFAKIYGATIHHVKPHGALYNMAAVDSELAEALAQAIFDLDSQLILYGLSGSALTNAGEKIGLQVAHEVFADRTYQPNGTLTPRSQPNALIATTEESLNQILQMIKEKRVKTVGGGYIPIKADTICIHGDGQHAVAIAKKIVQTLQQENIEIRSMG